LHSQVASSVAIKITPSNCMRAVEKSLADCPGVEMNNPATSNPSGDPQPIAIESEFEITVPGRTGYFGTLLRA